MKRQKAAAEQVLARQRAWAASMQQQHLAGALALQAQPAGHAQAQLLPYQQPPQQQEWTSAQEVLRRVVDGNSAGLQSAQKPYTAGRFAEGRPVPPELQAPRQEARRGSRGLSSRPNTGEGKASCSEVRTPKPDSRTPKAETSRWTAETPQTEERKASKSEARTPAAGTVATSSRWGRPERRERWADVRSTSFTDFYPCTDEVSAGASGAEEREPLEAGVDSGAGAGAAARRGTRRRGKVSEYGAPAPVEEPPPAPTAEEALKPPGPRTRRRGKFPSQEEAEGPPTTQSPAGDGRGALGWREAKGCGKAASNFDEDAQGVASRRRRRR